MTDRFPAFPAFPARYEAVTYLTNNRQHMRYGRALEKGWPIATGMTEDA